MDTQRQLEEQLAGSTYLSDTDTREPDKQRNRSEQISRRDDKADIPYIGIGDIDEALVWYFNNVIKPQATLVDGTNIQVPIVYASPEKWQAVQKEGFYRDKDGKRQLPVIIFKRESLDHDRRMTSKVDANYPHNFYLTAVTKPSQRNYYDRFSLIQNRKPEEAYVITVVPDYVKLNYACTILTDFMYQTNAIIEAVNFASDAWWGPEDRFKFQSFIDSFKTDTVVDQNQDRTIKTSFAIKLNGYILPNTVNANPYTMLKRYKKTKLISSITEQVL